MDDPEDNKHKKRKVILVGIVMRLLGGTLILLGDGHTSLLSKALVILGVILSVTGIGILRYLLLSLLFSKVGAKVRASA